MVINISVNAETRELTASTVSAGTTGEDNATTLHFEIPVTLQSYTRKVKFNGFPSVTFWGNDLSISSMYLTEPSLRLQLIFTGDDYLWKSQILKLNLNASLPDELNADGQIAQEAFEIQHRLDKSYLIEALEASDRHNGVTGSDYTEYSFNDLLVEFAGKTFLTPDNIRDLSEYDEVKDAALFDTTKTPLQMINAYHQITDISTSPIEDITDYIEIKSAAAQTENKNPVEMIGVWKVIEDTARIMTDRIPLLSSQGNASGMTNYRLPWLPTIALTGLNFNVGYVNPNCLEYGFDCSSMSYDGLSTGRGGRLFWNYGPVDSDFVQTEKIKITNMQNITIASDLFYGWQHVTDIELTGCSNFSEIKRMFSRCSALVNITGDPIDLSHVTTDTNAEAPFYRCYSLREIRLAADSLSVSLSLADSHSLSADSIISILNSAGANGSGKTITFNSILSTIVNGAAADAVTAATSRGWQIALATV